MRSDGPATTVRRRYRPGSWFAVLGARVVVVLPPSEKQRVARVWEVVDAGADFATVLDELLRDGLRGLAGFALLDHTGAEVHLLVRGPVRASLDTEAGMVEVDGDEAVTWVERSCGQVSGWSLAVTEAGDAADADEAVEAAEMHVGTGLVRMARVACDPQPVDSGASVSAEDAKTGLVPLPGTGPPAGPPVARLVLPGGETVDVDRTVLLGRAPDARRASASGEPRLVAVHSPQQEVSATHVEVRPGDGVDLGAAVVTDLSSTNGTVVTQPRLTPTELLPGVAVSLLPGALIDLGDGVTIQVTGP